MQDISCIPTTCHHLREASDRVSSQTGDIRLHCCSGLRVSGDVMLRHGPHRRQSRQFKPEACSQQPAARSLQLRFHPSLLSYSLLLSPEHILCQRVTGHLGLVFLGEEGAEEEEEKMQNGKDRGKGSSPGPLVRVGARALALERTPPLPSFLPALLLPPFPRAFRPPWILLPTFPDRWSRWSCQWVNRSVLIS